MNIQYVPASEKHIKTAVPQCDTADNSQYPKCRAYYFDS